jgi:hypothetical protein
MKRLIAATAVALVGLAMPALATHRPGHRDSARITADTKPFVVTFGSSATVAGRLTGNNTANRPVTLAEDPYPYGDGFANVATVNTDANGNYSFRTTPATNRNYRVSAGGEQAFTGVRVRMRVTLAVSDSTPRDNSTVRFAGFVAPAHNGRTVLIQRRTATGFWRVVRRVGLVATTNGRSRYATSLTIRSSGRYRARVLNDGDHLTSTGPSRFLTVTD